MYRILLVCIALQLGLSSLLFASGVDISVIINNFRNNKGQILLALHNKPEAFPSNPDLAVQSIFIPFETQATLKKTAVTVTHTFKNVLPGTYAITSVHDENSNDDIDLGFFGPVEGYGTSNDIRGIFGPPKFHDAKFVIADQNVTIPISMGY